MASFSEGPDIFFKICLVFCLISFVLLATLLLLAKMRIQKKLPSPRKFLFVILIVLVVFSITLTAAEAYFRYALDFTDCFGATLMSEKWHRRHYRFNPIGFRDDISYELNISGGKRRVTFLGDAVAVGMGIPEVSNRFVNLVRNAKNDIWEIHLLGENGLTTGSEMGLFYQVLRHGYQPDLVILVYRSTDISDLLAINKQIALMMNQFREHSGWVIQNSFFLNWAYFQIFVMNHPILKDFHDKVSQAYQGPLWEVQKNRFFMLQQMIHQSQARLAIVMLPEFERLGTRHAYFNQHQKVKDYWRTQGVSVLDLVSAFQENKSQVLCLRSAKEYPNQTAHRKIAQSLIPFIETEFQTFPKPARVPIKEK